MLTEFQNAKIIYVPGTENFDIDYFRQMSKISRLGDGFPKYLKMDPPTYVGGVGLLLLTLGSADCRDMQSTHKSFVNKKKITS